MLRKIIAAVAGAAAFLLPATASATTSVPVTYTKSYAGYSSAALSAIGGGVYVINADLFLPPLGTLAKVTNGVTAEIRVSSSVGLWEFQLGANPQTQTAFHLKLEHNGSVVGSCGGNPIPSANGNEMSMQVRINYDSNDYPGVVVEASDSSGNFATCWDGRVAAAWPGPSYSKVYFVDGFNVASYHKPASPVGLAEFMDLGFQQGDTPAGMPANYPLRKFVATSTGTSYGTVRARPGTLDLNDNFGVTMP
jgi:hypothetical protein